MAGRRLSEGRGLAWRRLTRGGDFGADVNQDEALLTEMSAHYRALDQGNPLRRWVWDQSKAQAFAATWLR